MCRKDRSPLFYTVENLIENPVFGNFIRVCDHLRTRSRLFDSLQSRHVENKADGLRPGRLVCTGSQPDRPWTIETTGLRHVRTLWLSTGFRPVFDPRTQVCDLVCDQVFDWIE